MSDNETETDRRMLEALVCPLTQAVLTYDAEAHELISKAAHLAYPIRDGIPIMLEGEARAVPAEEIEAMPPRTPVLG